MNTIPLKWAVEITSLQNAERLQALFPEERLEIGNAFSFAYRLFKWDYRFCLDKKDIWNYASIEYYQENNPHTILTITEVETILNDKP